MRKKFWKKYGKPVAAAVFLTVAGLCYGFARVQPEAVFLDQTGQVISEKMMGSVTESQSEVSSGVKTGDGGAADETEASQVPMYYVHVCGEVKIPGVYELPEGSRIFEALEKAGGFTGEASESSLNLAEQIADGMQIVVLSKDEARKAAETAAEQANGLVNINRASKEQLMTLPGIGESRAEDILRYREESGGFQKIEDIMKVSGIKDAAFQKIKDSITV